MNDKNKTRKQRVYAFGDDRFELMCIYSITNKINNKVYVGQSVGVVAHRWRNHVVSGSSKSAIKAAILKYGIDNFEFKVIDKSNTIDELNIKEMFWIKEINSLSPNGYNLETGGNNGVPSEESKRKMSESHIKRLNGKVGKSRFLKSLTEEQRSERKLAAIQKMRRTKIGKPSQRKGVKCSQETIDKIRLSKVGKSVPKKWKKIIRDDGIIYESVKLAVSDIGCNRTTIHKHLSGKLKTLFGRTYKYFIGAV